MIKSNKPVLFLTLGFPGSGKTYFARRFAKDHDLVHLNSDAIRDELFVEPKYSRTENKILFRAMDIIADRLLSQGINVIYDANLTKKIFRQRLYKIAKNNNADRLLLWFQIPVDQALMRLKNRSDLKSKKLKKMHVPVDEQILNRIKDEEEHPTRSEKHITLSGSSLYKKQKRVVESFINN